MGRNTKHVKSPAAKTGNTPRQIRMPPVLDQWLEEEAAATGFQSVADKVREIVAEARAAKLRQQEEQAA